MSDHSSQPNRRPPYDSDSTYCVNIVVEVLAEFTSRPVSPERRAVLLAERENLAWWLQQLKDQESQTTPRPTPPDGNDVNFT